jgi:uncharacterized phage protein (TIGR01671 family)
MNRTIKFRGKRAEGGKWIYGFYIKAALYDYEKIRYQMDDYTWVEETIIPGTSGQLIGLQDSIGREIYEDDVVRWDDCSNGKYWRFAVVKINPDIQFDCQPIKAFSGIENTADCVFKYGNFAYTETQGHLEIIGNIHDNPELLTTK